MTAKNGEQHVLARTPEIDLAVYHKVYTYGDLRIYLTWLFSTAEACIVIVPNRRIISAERVVPCIVPLQAAFNWDEHMGDGRHTAQQAHRFAQNLGLDPHPQEVMKIVMAVRDVLGELTMMPPMPDYRRTKVADMIVTNDTTGEITHKEITDNV